MGVTSVDVLLFRRFLADLRNCLLHYKTSIVDFMAGSQRNPFTLVAIWCHKGLTYNIFAFKTLQAKQRKVSLEKAVEKAKEGRQDTVRIFPCAALTLNRKMYLFLMKCKKLLI